MVINQQQKSLDHPLIAMLDGKIKPQNLFNQLYQPYRNKSKKYYYDLFWLVSYGLILINLLIFLVTLIIYLVYYQAANSSTHNTTSKNYIILGKTYDENDYQELKNWSSNWWIWLIFIVISFVAFSYCQFNKIGWIMRSWQYLKYRWLKKWLTDQELVLVTTFWLSSTAVKLQFYTSLSPLIKQRNSPSLNRLGIENIRYLENLINLAQQVKV